MPISRQLAAQHRQAYVVWKSAAFCEIVGVMRFTHSRIFEYAFDMTASSSPATVAALVDSLRYDPFYVAITEEFADDEARRRWALARYFEYSMSEGARMGRLRVWPDESVGAAVWLLPAETSVSDLQRKAKAEFLGQTLGTAGADAYRRIIDF